MRSSREIREVVSAGKRVGSSGATLHFLPSEVNQFAIIVSKAVGSAVDRNRVKRRIRAVLRNLNPDSTLRAAVRVKPAAAKMSFQELSQDLQELFKRAT